MEALSTTETWKADPRAGPVLWNSAKCSFAAGRKLRIGFITDDGVVRPQPPIIRAVKEVVTALRAAGHEGIITIIHSVTQDEQFDQHDFLVIEWDATCHARGFELFEKAVLSDGGAAAKRMTDLSGEPLIEGMYIGTAANLLSTPQLHEVTSSRYLSQPRKEHY
jgi:amidase